MRISRWGNSLAVRIPAKLVEELGLKEGDEVSLDLQRSEAGALLAQIKKLDALPKLFPADYRFKRDDAYEEK